MGSKLTRTLAHIGTRPIGLQTVPDSLSCILALSLQGPLEIDVWVVMSKTVLGVLQAEDAE
jgi:hypothetical protein